MDGALSTQKNGCKSGSILTDKRTLKLAVKFRKTCGFIAIFYLANEPLLISIHVPFIYSGDSVASHMIVFAIS